MIDSSRDENDPKAERDAAAAEAAERTVPVGEPSPFGAIGATLDPFFDELLSKYDLEALIEAELPRASSGEARYSRGALLGRGGMGEVYQAWDRDLRRNVAMKTLAGPDGESSSERPASTHPQLVARFLEEAQISGQLEHPGIVPVHELGIDDQGRMFFTMSLVEGQELREILDAVREGREGWSVTRVLGILARVCDAMAYAHSRGVVHRDLKPSNIMVGQFGETYVMDWGLAKVWETDAATPAASATAEVESSGEREVRSAGQSGTRVRTHRSDLESRDPVSPLFTYEGTVVGTPLYMAPEQAGLPGHPIGPWTDVYAVGVILYTLLAGESPFAGESLDAKAILDRVRQADYPALESRAPRAPAELVAICEKAMALVPTDRYPTMREMAADLSAYLENRVVRAHRTGAWAEFRKWVRRNRATATSVLAGLVLSLAALGALYVSESQRSATLERESDLHWITGAEATAADLWPAHPELLPELDRWLERAALALSREDQYRAELAALEAEAPAYSEADRARDRVRHPEAERLARLEKSLPAGPPAGDDNDEIAALRATIERLRTEVSQRRTWGFEGAAAQEHAALTRLVEGLERLRESGLHASMQERRDFASTIEERSVTGPEAKRAWQAAIDAIAASPRYGGLRLEPMIGLLPLGENPATGLWDFWHLQSGARPERAPEGSAGRYRLADDSGLVFVLLPGGSFLMGADEDDPDAFPEEKPPHRVELAPFFLSVFEVTQGQWQRLEGSNPSFFYPRPGTDRTPLHPVEAITWDEAERFVSQLGLALPTEAQWEYAARVGTREPYGNGADATALHGFANLGDLAAARVGFHFKGGDADWTEFDDGHGRHAPVGTYRANPWGLHDLHGNVAEWCRDLYVGDYTRYGVADATAERLVPEHWKRRVVRGGSFMTGPHVARVSNRMALLPKRAQYDLGFRPALQCVVND